jgi:hypothetical protein
LIVAVYRAVKLAPTVISGSAVKMKMKFSNNKLATVEKIRPKGLS